MDYQSEHSKTSKNRGQRSKGPAFGKGSYESANYLLNFKYEELEKPQPQKSYNRRNNYIAPFKKEKFLQANYRFLVAENGDYSSNLKDPDLMVEWDSVEQVNLQTHNDPNCPICLGPFIAAKAGKCGHVFCWPCIIRYLSYTPSKQVGTCPICFEYISLKDLKSAVVETTQQYKINSPIKFVLIKRSRSSMVPMPRSEWSGKIEQNPNITNFKEGSLCSLFLRFSITSDVDSILSRESAELSLALSDALSEQDDSSPHIITAQEQLQIRENSNKITKRASNLANSGTVSTNDEQSSKLRNSNNGVRHRRGSSAEIKTPTLNQSLEKVVDAWEEPCKYESFTPSSKLQSIKETNENPKSEIETNPTTDTNNTNNTNINNNNNSINVNNNTNVNMNINESEDIKENRKRDEDPESSGDFYYFYQAIDGQLIFLNQLNVSILLNEYGTFDDLPNEIEADIMEIEDFRQNDKIRRKFKSLMHIPLTANFGVAEVDIRKLVSKESIKPFMESIQNRIRKRKQLKKKEQLEFEKEKSKMDEMKFKFGQQFKQVSKVDFQSEEEFPQMSNEFDSDLLGSTPPQQSILSSSPSTSILSTTPPSTSSSTSQSTPTKSFANAVSKTEESMSNLNVNTNINSNTPSFKDALRSQPLPKPIPLPTQNITIKKTKQKGKEYLVLSNTANHRRRQ